MVATMAVTMVLLPITTTQAFTISSWQQQVHLKSSYQHASAGKWNIQRRAVANNNKWKLSLAAPSTPNGEDDDNNTKNGAGAEPSTAGSTTSLVDYTNMHPQVYPQRWVQLGYLSILALLSDWICFSVDAAPETFEASFNGHSAASLIDIFLFTNVASCFLVTDVVAKIGLQRSIQGAAILMTLGCWFRSGFAFLVPMAHAVGIQDNAPLLLAANRLTADTVNSGGLVPYPLIIIGTLLVGAAQPFFQCTPPLLSAQWFAADERATSTAVALNFNQIGIATAFLVGGAMATDPGRTRTILWTCRRLVHNCGRWDGIAISKFATDAAVIVGIGKIERNEKEPPFLESVQTFFATPGFTRPLAAFVCSITITNVVGAFIDDVMKRGGIMEQFQIDLAGAGFEIAILLGGIVIGGYVDRTKEYKMVTMACIASTAALLIPLGLTEHRIGNEPILLILALLGLGMAAGPVQPINAELAVDVTYPGDETAVESVQQIGGNLISALLVPIAERASKLDYQILPKNPELASDIRGDVVLLTVIAGITLAYFASFDAPLRRSLADDGDGDDETSPAISEESPIVAIDSTLPDEVEKESLNILL
ncbi:major facilitator superfamily-like protein [Fragilaria crotonensis]|nr:major facilitator superfamily-like protein [Fragilaria crotonensis]